MRNMCYVRIILFVFGWLSTSVCQMAPFGIESLLFGGLGAFPPPPPPPMRFPLGLGGLFGQGQFAPGVIGMPPSMGGYSMGGLPFPLFPTPCDMGCNQGGLFFANINVNNQGSSMGMPGGGMPGGGMPGGGLPGGGLPGGGLPGGGLPGGGLPGGGMPGGGRPGGGMPGGGMPGGGMPGMPLPGGMPGGGIPTTPRPGGGGMPGGMPGGTGSPTRPPTGLPPTTMPTRPPQSQSPNMNAQFLYFVPNWCSGWCRLLYRPRPFFPPPPPPPPIFPMPIPRSAFLIFSWLGL